MTRPSRNQDQLLIDTAKRLLPQMGISGMSLQKISAECGVNLGMFHYHFKNKATFVRKVLDSLNEDIEKNVEQVLLQGRDPLEKLRSTLIVFALNILSQKKILVSMFRDLMNEDEGITDFIAAVSGKRHARLIPLILECQKEGYLEQLPLAQVMAFISVGVNFPNLIAEALDRSPKKKLRIPNEIKKQFATREATIQRIDLALRALAPRPMGAANL